MLGQHYVQVPWGPKTLIGGGRRSEKALEEGPAWRVQGGPGQHVEGPRASESILLGASPSSPVEVVAGQLATSRL